MKKCIVCCFCSFLIFFLGIVFGVTTNLTIFQPVVITAYRVENNLVVEYARNPITGVFRIERNLELALSENFWIDNCGYGGYETKERQKEMRGTKRNFEPK